MKNAILILIVFVTGFINGFSCTCDLMSFKNEIDSADLIFQGIPISKRLIDTKVIYKFQVNKVWKGKYNDTIEIETGYDSRMCGMVFEMGKIYVVYSKNGQTSYCRRNAIVDKTFDDLKLDYKFLPEYSLTSFTGIDKQLNDNESNYLNQQFSDLANQYDFKGKSIIFTSNRTVINKKDWFQSFWFYDKPVTQLVKLSDQEKREIGYDAILVTYCKMMITDKMKKKILNQIKKSTAYNTAYK